ncbi:MAG TPA: adenosine deaminase [Xanthobacteraceae bacterium]|jgi:adenosine deaminase
MVESTNTFPDVPAPFHAFLAAMPKAELHVHIEGTITPRQQWEIAARNGIRLPYAGIAEIEAAQTYEAPDAPSYLRKFLATYYERMDVLRTERDFRDIMLEHLRRCREDNVRYAEVMFDPQPHMERGVPFPALFEGLEAGRREGKAKYGVGCNFILSINRDRSLESARAAMDQARRYRERITGFGIDSIEEGNPPAKFMDLYERARAEGYRLTAHCDVDQADAVSHIRDCLEMLRVERIDHGINAIEDDRLVEALRERAVCMTPCPTWRAIDRAPRRVDRIRIMHERGLKVTLNTDDPGLFASGTLGTMLPPVAAAGGFSPSDMIELMRNAFAGAWLPAAERARHLAELDAFAARHIAGR